MYSSCMHLIVLEKQIAQHLKLLVVLLHNSDLTVVIFGFLGVYNWKLQKYAYWITEQIFVNPGIGDIPQNFILVKIRQQ